MCPSLKTTTTNTCRLMTERWVRQMHLNEHDRFEWNYVLRWMGFTSVSCLMDACISVSALAQRLIMNTGIRLRNESYTGWPLSQCRTSCNVTNYQLWRGRRQIPSFARADQSTWQGKLNTIWFKFWINVILSVSPNDDKHDKFSISNYFSSENVRNCLYSRGSRICN